jgi:hypothetical protein
MRNVSDKNLDKNQIKQFIFCNFSENVEECGGAGQAMHDNITRRMLIPWRITKATNTHSEYVMLIAFPVERWLIERVSVLRCTCTVCHDHKLSYENYVENIWWP